MINSKSKQITLILVSIFAFGTSTNVFTAEMSSSDELLTERITEGFKSLQSTPQSTRVIQSKTKPLQSRHASSRWFELYDVNTILYDDVNNNGFYSSFDLEFDVDVEYGDAWVYAEIWIRSEHGHYELLHTTNVFNIQGQGGHDEYIVSTNLIEDYRSNYYDLLIELYDDDFSHYTPVATASSAHYGSLNDLPLESRFTNHDGSHHGHGGVSASFEVSGAGAFSWMLPLLIILGWSRVRKNGRGG